MKKQVLPRFIGLLLLYSAIFVLLVIIQFTKQNGFTRRIGAMLVSGHYGVREAGMNPLPSGEQALSGEVSVFFGGMEFRLNGEKRDDGFRIVRPDEEQDPAAPLSLAVSDDSALFRFARGEELRFALQNGDGRELRISGNFDEEGSVMELPYRPMRNTRIRELGDARFIVEAEGVQYSFGRASLDRERQIILLEANGISYRAVPEAQAFSPAQYVIPQAEDPRAYREAVTQWRDNAYAQWRRNPGSLSDEARIVAYIAEALRRETYGAAVASLSPAVRTGSRMTFDSAVYLGQLDRALQSIAAFDRDTGAGISRLIRDGSADFLKEPHVFIFLGIRGFGSLIDEGAALVRTMDPAALSGDIIPGILEGFADWRYYRSHGDNPFERLLEPALARIPEGIRKDGEGVLFFAGSRADSVFNLRLGLALDRYGEETGDEDWAALGRSLVLSILALDENAGSVPAGLRLSDNGDIQPEPGEDPIDAARLCRLLAPDGYPRALGIGAGVNGIWAYTAAPAVQVSQVNNTLDIAVSFPAGETHYMLIRGLRPFVKIQLYNIDYRTDPQFERYDSSGWSYSSAEQTLLLKMKHRDDVEHIRIFY
ncbi:MAG: hypothetical protein LBQ38_05510 [Spirochaetaceae bacterium]|nr:hypothetical protein [Spirochaetaceae bacterium]